MSHKDSLTAMELLAGEYQGEGPLRMVRKTKGVKDYNTLDMENRVCVFMDYCFLLIRNIPKYTIVTDEIMDYHWKRYNELVRKALEVFFDMEESRQQKYLEQINTI